MPIVRIEKHRSTMAGNSNDPNMISEYEFPIDLEYEFPRGQLELGKTSARALLVKSSWRTLMD